MAILDGKNLRGSIGNLSFSKQGKLNIVKSKPGKGNVKQTEATKKTASIFGAYISPLAKYIRLSFRDLLGGFYDGQMVNRMNSDISTVLYQNLNHNGTFRLEQNSFARLDGFNFNQDSVLNKSFLIKPEISFSVSGVEVRLREFSGSKGIRFPKKADSCTIELQVVQFNLEKGLWMVYPLVPIEVDPTGVNAAVEFQFPFPAGSLCLVGLRCLFTGPFNAILNNKTFNPTAVVGSTFNVGSCTAEELEHWYSMTVKMTLEDLAQL